MLEYMAEGEDHVWLYICDECFEGSDHIKFKSLATEIGNGAFYLMESYKGIEINLDMWLCDVTLHVMGRFPEKIYLSRA